MGLFSKEICVFCGNSVGALNRKKMRDKAFICKECEKNCSAFIDISRFDTEFAKAHFEYMKKQDILYKKEFEPIPEKEKFKMVLSFNGFVFADSIAMFEIVSPKVKKHNYKELFRCDQVQSYEIYTVDQTDSNAKGAYKEVGIEVKFRCAVGPASAGMSDQEKAQAHPYLDVIRVPLLTNSDVDGRVEDVINHFDEVFLREPTYKAFSTGIKEKFTGTKTEKRNAQQGINALKALGGLAKAAASKDADVMENAKEAMKDVAVEGMNAFSDNRLKLKELADAAEKRAWRS